LLKRAVHKSANDYDSILRLVDSLNIPDRKAYEQTVTSLADVEQWMHIFAFEHIVNNFDSFGHQIGKNMYAYKPERGKWQMLLWDIDWLMQVSERQHYTAEAPLFQTEDPTVGRMYDDPEFQRAYWHAVADALEGPLAGSALETFIDAKVAGLRRNGIPATDASEAKVWLRDRRRFLQEQLASVHAEFAVTNSLAIPGNGSRRRLHLAGTAPVEVARLRLAAHPLALNWTSLTAWDSAEVELDPGEAPSEIEALERNGSVLMKAPLPPSR
jgi:hypothetical protein